MHIKNKFRNFLLFNILYTILFLNSSISYANTNLTTDKEVQLNEEAQKTPDLTAEGAIVIDADTGIVIYNKNMNERLYPASTTKIMTVLLALENGNLTDVIKHSHNAVFNIGASSSHIGMRENEEITLEQALYAMLLASANEVCMAVAEYVSGSVEDFVELMNKKAKELGALDTNFVNPHGFHDDNHYTTSYDLSLIMKEALKYDKFKEVIATDTYTIPETNIVNESRVLNNTNKMIKSWSEFYYPNVIGGKTGFTDEAKNTLVTYAKNGNSSIISVVLKCEGKNVYSDTAKLLDYGFSIYENIEIFDKSTFTSENTYTVTQTFNENTINLGDIKISPENNLSLNLPNTIDTSKIKQVLNMPEVIVAPVNISDVVGTLDFVYDDKVIGSVNLVSETSVQAIPETKLVRNAKIKKVVNIMLKLLVYFIVFIIVSVLTLFISAAIVRNNRKKKRRKLRFINNNPKQKLKSKKYKRNRV